MAITHRRGDHILPGFDCETGEAVSFHAAEWRAKIQGMTRHPSYVTQSIRVYTWDKKLRYEIYATEAELR